MYNTLGKTKPPVASPETTNTLTECTRQYLDLLIRFESIRGVKRSELHSSYLHMRYTLPKSSRNPSKLVPQV